MFSRNFLSDSWELAQYPAINVYADKDNAYVEAELPGVHSENIDITVEGDVLIIQGKKELSLENNTELYRDEIFSGSFERAVKLPSKIDADKIEATSKNGVLSIKLPMPEEVKPKKIEVKVK